MVRDYPTIMQMGRPIDILKRQAQEIYNLLRDKQVALFDYIEYVYQRYK
jgi:hypothetical protein